MYTTQDVSQKVCFSNGLKKLLLHQTVTACTILILVEVVPLDRNRMTE